MLRSGRLVLACICWLASITLSSAQTPSPSPQAASGPHVDFAGYVQVQCARVSEDSVTEDRVIFRRIYLTAAATLNEQWSAQAQVDLAPVSRGERLLIRDTFLRYKGLQNRGITLTLGNQKTPFARAVLTSASRRIAR